jgi:hypothetical protein
MSVATAMNKTPDHAAAQANSRPLVKITAAPLRFDTTPPRPSGFAGDRLRFIIIFLLRSNGTKPRPAPLHYGSPLRTAGSREASTSPCRAEIGFSPDCPPRSVF